MTTLKNLAKILLIPLAFSLSDCSDSYEKVNGVIVNESFHPGDGGWNRIPDRYDALVKLADGSEQVFSFTEDEARKADLI